MNDKKLNQLLEYLLQNMNAEKQYSLDVYVSEDKPELYNELFIAEYYENNKHQHVSRETPKQIFDFIND